MTKDLYDQIIDALRDRQDWEKRQTTWYTMRHNGLRRAVKPYPGAPDMHFPLADSTIDKLKPFYFQQLYSTDTLASFISLRQQDTELTTAVSAWFDYQLKQKSNLEREILCAIDNMLMNGFAPIKTYWCVEENELRFDACDPLHVIVPDWTEEIQEADWVVHVLQLSEDQYKANKNYQQDEDFIKRIKGKPKDEAGDTYKKQSSTLREGITYGKDEQIVLWEVWKRDRDTGKTMVETISPVLPYGEEDNQENDVRPPFVCPYNYGKTYFWHPFLIIRSEVKDKGYYSPRGITEIVAPFEASLCRIWNVIHEWMDFFAKPNFESDQPVPNTANYKNAPGSILPPGVRPSNPPPVPDILQEQMTQTRATAEYRVQMPDLGANQHLAPGSKTGDRVTATQINAIVGQSGQGNDIRARLFRLDTGDIFKMAWCLYQQYGKNDLTFLLQDELSQLDPSALHDEYLITPNGSGDNWNKGAQMQKATMRMQLLQGNPFINQGELVKSVLALDEPKLIQKLYEDPQDQSQRQGKVQNLETLLMENKFGVPIDQADDDKAHLTAMIQYFQGLIQEIQQGQEQPPNPITAQLLSTHGKSHLQALSQKKDPAAHQAAQAIAPFLKLLDQIAATQQQPGNVIPMQGPDQAGPPNTPALPQGEAPAPSPQETADKRAATAVQTGNMLANLIKAQVPVSHADINTIFAELGLPNLPTNPIEIHPPQSPVPPAAPLPPVPPKQPRIQRVVHHRDGSGKIAWSEVHEGAA